MRFISHFCCADQPGFSHPPGFLKAIRCIFINRTSLTGNSYLLNNPLEKEETRGLRESVYNHPITCSFQPWKEFKSMCLLLLQNRQPCEDFGKQSVAAFPRPLYSLLSGTKAT